MSTISNSCGKPEAQVSKTFCAKDADISFQSADGVIFLIHSLNLKACTEGFSPPDGSSFREIVILTESSSTLELLFQFIYPSRHPDLAEASFETLDALSEAAEKYQVFPAMNICSIRMREKLPFHADSIMAYASKHGYPQIMNEAAPLLLQKPLQEVAALMPHHMIIPWLIYYGRYQQVAAMALLFPQKAVKREPSENTPTSTVFGPSSGEAFGQSSGGAFGAFGQSSSRAFGQPVKSKVDANCEDCGNLYEKKVIDIMAKLGGTVGSLRILDAIFGQDQYRSCSTCKRRLLEWKISIENDIRLLPAFTSIIS